MLVQAVVFAICISFKSSALGILCPGLNLIIFASNNCSKMASALVMSNVLTFDVLTTLSTGAGQVLTSLELA